MRKCDICGRGPQTGNRRSHSNIATKRKQALNLHSKIIGGKRMRICTKCLKKSSKVKAARITTPARSRYSVSGGQSIADGSKK